MNSIALWINLFVRYRTNGVWDRCEVFAMVRSAKHTIRCSTCNDETELTVLSTVWECIRAQGLYLPKVRASQDYLVTSPSKAA